ncbi:cypmaclein-like [Curcuma longa]|uniref:cypmaclein-like n=1 Tax=Curcuma longa TaxID=136217 RepID=UPI003D9EB925
MALCFKQLLFAMLLVCFLLNQDDHLANSLVEADSNFAGEQDIGKPAPALDCTGLCGTRCSAQSRPNRCLRACGTCCVRCKCVPPGTSGNREMCGTCYTNMTTHANRTKCP